LSAADDDDDDDDDDRSRDAVALTLTTVNRETMTGMTLAIVAPL
jgi:hypothetical protein